MPTANKKKLEKRAREAFNRMFPRGETGVVCRREPTFKSRGADRMLREDRHVTKAALREIAEKPELREA